jgi:hypothetical protein
VELLFGTQKFLMSEMALFWEMFLEETTLLSQNRRLVWNLWEFPALLFFGGYSW